MKLIVGLGNPGSEYLNNRHNLGFIALDSLSIYYQFEAWKTKLYGMFTTKLFGSEKIILVKPQTYMNLSGFCVAKFKQFFKVNDDDIFVIYDDIDLSFGDKRLKQGGGDAGPLRPPERAALDRLRGQRRARVPLPRLGVRQGGQVRAHPGAP